MYKPGDKIKKEHLNALVGLLGDGFSAAGFTSSSGELVQKKRQEVGLDVIIQPTVAMPAYSAYGVTDNGGLNSFYIDGDVKRPVFRVSKISAIDNGGALVITNGAVALTAGELGWGKIMKEGDFHWIAAAENCTGICGFDGTSTLLKKGYPGFLSGGSGNLDVGLASYVTRYHSTLLGKAVSGGGANFAAVNITLYKSASYVGPGNGTPTLTTTVITAYNPAPSAITAGANCLLLPHLGFYYCVELC